MREKCVTILSGVHNNLSKGKEVITHLFDVATHFSNVVALVRIGTKWKYIKKVNKHRLC